MVTEGEGVSESSAVPGAREGEQPQRTSPMAFFRQVVAELRKVVWPTQQQLITYFIVTMVFVVVLMTIISLLDLAFGKLVFEIFTGGDQL